METTHSFIQIRSAPIRLRRELQAIGFLTPLEIEHAMIQTNGDEADVGNALVSQGYRKEEVQRAINRAVSYGVIQKNGSNLSLRDERRAIVRQNLLLDILSLYGRDIQPGTTASAGSVLVPGHGAFFGLEMDELVNIAIDNAGSLRDDILHSRTFAADIKALSGRGNCLVGR